MLTTLLALGKCNLLNPDFVYLQNKGQEWKRVLEYWGIFIQQHLTLSNKLTSSGQLKFPNKESYREILSSSSHTHNKQRQTQT